MVSWLFIIITITFITAIIIVSHCKSTAQQSAPCNISQVLATNFSFSFPLLLSDLPSQHFPFQSLVNSDYKLFTLVVPLHASSPPTALSILGVQSVRLFFYSLCICSSNHISFASFFLFLFKIYMTSLILVCSLICVTFSFVCLPLILHQLLSFQNSNLPHFYVFMKYTIVIVPQLFV